MWLSPFAMRQVLLSHVIWRKTRPRGLYPHAESHSRWELKLRGNPGRLGKPSLWTEIASRTASLYYFILFFILFYFISFHFISFFCFLGPDPRHKEVPRLGIESELQLLVYTTVTATPDPNYICDLHHSSGQCRIPDPLSKARD